MMRATASTEKRIIVHVGLPKTASTFLQRELFPYLKDVHYLDRSRASELRDVHRLVQQASRRLFADAASDVSDLHREAARRLARVDEPAVLISNETFAGDVGIGFLDCGSMAQAIQTLFPQGRIFCVLRRQDSFLESLYKHAVAKGYASSIELFVNLGAPARTPVKSPEAKIYTDHNIDYRHVDLARLATILVETFGRDRCLFLPYEMLRDQPDAFVGRFLQFAATTVTQPVNPNRRRNLGVSGRALAVLQRANRIPRLHAGKRIDALLGLPRSGRTRDRFSWADRLGRMRIRDVVSSLDRIGGYRPARPLDEAARQAIRAHHGARNRALAPLLDVDLADFGYFAPTVSAAAFTTHDAFDEIKPAD